MAEKLPRGKNQLANWFFEEFIKIIKNRLKGVYRVEGLKDKNFDEKNLSNVTYVEVVGLYKDDTVYIEHSLDRVELVKTLIHELAHALIRNPEEEFDNESQLYDDDIPIQELEELLWNNFSKKQKKILAQFIPNHATLFPNGAP